MEKADDDGPLLIWPGPGRHSGQQCSGNCLLGKEMDPVVLAPDSSWGCCVGLVGFNLGCVSAGLSLECLISLPV